MAAQGIDNPIGLQKLVPTLQINPTLFGSGVIIRIRGFGSAANSATDPDVAAYVDGSYIPRPGAILSSFLDIKSVEVLSGPQGTLFGRNAAMGAISINTNDPSLTGQSLAGTAEAGSYGTYSGTAVANLPVNDQLAVRLAVEGSHTDGDYHSISDNKTYGESAGFVGRLSAKWKPISNLTWTIRGDLTNTAGDGVYPAVVYANTASASQLAALTGFIGHYGGSPPVYSNTPSYDFNQFIGTPFEHDHQFGVTSDLDWSLTPVLTLRLLDSTREWSNVQQSPDTVGTSLNLLSVRLRTNSRSESHELQLISAKDAFLDHKLGFTSGVYYFHEDFSLDTYFNAGSQFCNVVYGARAPTLVPGCLAGPQANEGEGLFSQAVDSYAVYGQASYEVLPDLEFDLGARESWDNKTGNYQSLTPNALAAAPIVAVEGPEGLKYTTTKPSVRASLSWHVTDKIMAFATYSTGYKSGGFNSGPATPALGVAARTFAAETVDDYEVGVKSVLVDGKVLFNATAFDTELSNFQDRSFNGTLFLTRNAGDVRSRGVDINGQIRPLSNLSFTYGATYLDSIYTNDVSAPGLEGCTGLAGCPTVQNLSGRTLEFSPKWQGNAGVEWKTDPFMGGYKAAIAATEFFTTSFLSANTDNPQSLLPGYHTTDLRLSFFSPDSRWQLDVFGSNVFNQHYYTTSVAQVLGAAMGINNTATGATIFRGFLGDPARVGVRISAKY